MSKKKTETKQNQQYSNTYGWMNTPINAQMQNVIDMANQPLQSKIDPSIQHRYAAMGEELERSYLDPFGPATSPDVRAKALRAAKLKLGAEADKAKRESFDDRSGEQFMRSVTAASMTAPQLVSTGGSSSGTSNTVQSGNFWANAMPIIGGVASGAAM